MANSALPIEYGLVPYGSVYEPVNMQVSSTTFKKGDPVIYSSGNVVVAAITSAAIIGVAMRDCASTDTTCPILINPDQLYTMQGSATAATNTQARCGVACDISGSTGAFIMSPAATTYKPIVPVALAPGETVATAYCKYIVKINFSTLAADQD